MAGKVPVHNPVTGQTTDVPEKSVAIYRKRGWRTGDEIDATATAAGGEADDQVVVPSTPGDGGHHTPDPTED